MDLMERVLAFFRRNPGLPFCEECVMAELRAKHPRTKEVISNAINQLSPSFVGHGVTVCSRCGLEKQTTTLLAVPGIRAPRRLN
jgi:hypothetical protein